MFHYEFLEALENDDVVQLQQLLALEPDAITMSDIDNGTMLHLAKIKCAQFLIQNGADINARDNEGDTPLHVARDYETAQALIAAGADLNAKKQQRKHTASFFRW